MVCTLKYWQIFCERNSDVWIELISHITKWNNNYSFLPAFSFDESNERYILGEKQCPLNFELLRWSPKRMVTYKGLTHNALKVGLSSSKKVLFYLLQWNPFKNSENDFYFMLKALFVLKIFIFLSWPLWSCRQTPWQES